MNRIFLDYASTTPVKQEVVDAMLPLFAKISEDQQVIGACLSTIESLLGADKGTLQFTPGGTYGNNYLIKGLARANSVRGKHIISTKIEHPSVRASMEALEKEGFRITYLDVNREGFVDLEDFERAIETETILASVIYINNEIGTIQPIHALGSIAHRHGVIFHVDGVQALGNVQINLSTLPVDAMTFSAHKIYAPKGSGLVYLRDAHDIEPLIHMGCETQNAPAIAGFCKAMVLAHTDLEMGVSKRRRLRKKMLEGLKAIDETLVINGPNEDAQAHPGIVNIYFPSMDGDSLVILYAFNGIAVSSGSACSSGAMSASPVLLALGYTEIEAKKCLRISLGDMTTEAEIEAFLDVTLKILKG